MTRPSTTYHASPPAGWAVLVALTLVYLCWGTTYLAIKTGVKTLPPFLFGGTRIGLAGLLALAYACWQGERLWLPPRQYFWLIVGSVILFAGGNGFVTIALKTIDSGVACVLIATTPLWMALLEAVWPAGERLTVRGWLGLVAGLAGVILLLMPGLQDAGAILDNHAPLLVVMSAVSWAFGSVLLRHHQRSMARLSHFGAAGYQMFFGGLGLVVAGVATGEPQVLSVEDFTAEAVSAFFYLLLAGSLLGFVAYNWLLGHVSAALAGTYAYVNPLVAVLAGWLLAGEQITSWTVGGMIVILTGVALVRAGGVEPRWDEAVPPPEDEVKRLAACPQQGHPSP